MEKEPIGWRDGNYNYCLTHSTSQVYTWEFIYENEHRRCDWCQKPLEGGK